MFLVDKLVKPLSNRINLSALTGTFSEAIRGLSTNVAQKDKVVTALNHSTSNIKGVDAELTSINCIKTNNGSSHTAIMSTGQIFTTGSVFSADILIHGSTGGSNRHALLGSAGVNAAFVVLGGVPKYRTNGLSSDVTFSTLTVSDNVNYNIKYERTAADTLVCTLTNLDTGAVATETGTVSATAQNNYMNVTTLNRIGISGSVKSRIKFTNVVYNNWKYPLQEGSGTKCFDIGGEGNHITLGADIWDTADSRASHNTQYGFDVDGSVKVPALNTKTKQVATFDGAADHVDFASALLDSAATFTVRVDINKYERTVGSNAWVVGGAADRNFGLNKTNHIFYRADDNVYLEFDGSGGTTDTSNLDLDGKSIVIKGSSDVIELFIDTVSYGTVTANSGKGLFYAARYGLGYSNTNHAFKGSLSRVALWNTANDGQDLSTALVNHEFQSDIGTTTIQDTTANNNDGTVTVGSGGTATFWGTRIADTAGSLVGADYATGNLTFSNPAGFINNGSECGIKFISTGSTTITKTKAQLDSHSNGTGLLYVSKVGDKITKLVQYDTASTTLTSTEQADNERYFS